MADKMRELVRYLNYLSHIEFVNPVHKILCGVLRKFCNIKVGVEACKKEDK